MALPLPAPVRKWISKRFDHGGLFDSFRGDLFVAVAPQSLGVSVMAASAWLSAFGPTFLADNWVVDVLLWLLTFAALGLVVFTSLFYEHWLVFFGSFFALSISLFAVHTAVDEWTFHVRGETTSCTVLAVKEREVTSYHTNADGSSSTTTSTYYDHDLRCDVPEVREMTTGSSQGDPGTRVDVAYDPMGRLNAQPAAGAGDFAPPMWIAAVGFTVGTALRVSYVVFRYRRRHRRR